MAFENIKQEQTKIIESIGVVSKWTKDRLINIIDLEVAAYPILDQKTYIIYVRSKEHPDGYNIGLTAHPVRRIRNGKIVRDSGQNPDSYFWTEEDYLKNKRKSSKYYLVGGDTTEYLENYVNLRNQLTDPEDGRQLSEVVAARKRPLEVMETPEEERYGVEVTKELLAALPKILESYNNDNAAKMVELHVGDLLVRDGPAGSFYYVVEKSLKEQTYSFGGITLL